MSSRLASVFYLGAPRRAPEAQAEACGYTPPKTHGADLLPSGNQLL
jgi:hypothetical protein